MLIHHLTLGLPPSAGEAEIRRRYLELVKAHPPEKNPERFQSITAAYEALKDRRSRIRAKLFAGIDGRDCETALRALKHQVPYQKKAVGLEELAAALKQISSGSRTK